MRLSPMRCGVLTLFLCASTAFAQTPFPTGAATTLGQQIAAITSAPNVTRAHWGIAVTAMDGTPIYGLNEGEFFRPASTNKLFTTAAAMYLLGPGSRLSTTVQATAFDHETRTVHGDLVLHGAGDANLSGRTFPYIASAERKKVTPSDPLQYIDQLASDIAPKVHRITGNIVGDDTLWPSEPYPSDWSIDDTVWGYGAPISALSIVDNQLELTVYPADKPGRPATAEAIPNISYYELQVQVQTVAAKAPASIRIDRAPGSRIVRIIGTIAMGEPYSTEIAIEDPAEFAALAFKAALESHGVTVDGKAIARHRLDEDTATFSTESRAQIPNLPTQPVIAAQPISVCLDDCPPHAEHVSPTLADDVTLTLKVSQNLHAELLLRRLGATYGTAGTSAQGVRVVRQFLINAGLDGDDFAFYDGSGLSGHDLVAPRAMAKLLSYAAQQPWFAQWKAALPVGGEDGTLSSRFSKPPLKDHIFAKTGTLSEARALSGYVDCASGQTVIFSIMVDNHAPNTSADRQAMDSIVAAIAASN